MSKLVVQLVTWNGEKYISDLFASLRNQKYTDWKLVILDNDSKDNTVSKIKNEIRNFPVDVDFIEEIDNLGFAGGHNKLFKTYNLTPNTYNLLLNQDMYVMPECFDSMVQFMDDHEDVGAVSPRLMKWDFVDAELCGLDTRINAEVLKKSFTDEIDSLGLKVFRNRRVIEMYTGEDWNKVRDQVIKWSSDEVTEVFGVSGAFPLYRASALRDVSFSDGTFLDESYGSYKEDVDLAFRLCIAGYSTFVLLDIVAYHDRSAAGQKDTRDIVASKNKKKQSEWVKYHSYKNHIMTLYKNEYWQNWMLDAIFIKWYEFKKFVWFLLFDRRVLKGLGEIWTKREELRGKREEVAKMRKVSWREMRKWWR